MSGTLRTKEDEDLSSEMMKTTGFDNTEVTSNLSDTVSKDRGLSLVRVRGKGVEKTIDMF